VEMPETNRSFQGVLLCRFQPGQTAFSHFMKLGKQLFWAFYIGKGRKAKAPWEKRSSIFPGCMR